jgi:hypothetical protein
MSSRLKTTISTSENIFDINGQWLPKGNYYFCIDDFTETTAKGELFERTFRAEYEFLLKDLVKMMSIAQARLARRANIVNENMPTSVSPTMSPVSRPTGLRFNRVRDYVNEIRRGRNIRETNETKENETTMCTICLELIEENEKNTLGCNHSFHNICINRWLSTNTNCPVCRRFVRNRNSTLPVISNTNQSIPSNSRIPNRYINLRDAEETSRENSRLRGRRNRNVRVTPLRVRTRRTNDIRTPFVLERLSRPVSRSRQTEYDRIYSSGTGLIR